MFYDCIIYTENGKTQWPILYRKYGMGHSLIMAIYFSFRIQFNMTTLSINNSNIIWPADFWISTRVNTSNLFNFTVRLCVSSRVIHRYYMIRARTFGRSWFRINHRVIILLINNWRILYRWYKNVTRTENQVWLVTHIISIYFNWTSYRHVLSPT